MMNVCLSATAAASQVNCCSYISYKWQFYSHGSNTWHQTPSNSVKRAVSDEAAPVSCCNEVMARTNRLATLSTWLSAMYPGKNADRTCSSACNRWLGTETTYRLKQQRATPKTNLSWGRDIKLRYIQLWWCQFCLATVCQFRRYIIYSTDSRISPSNSTSTIPSSCDMWSLESWNGWHMVWLRPAQALSNLSPSHSWRAFLRANLQARAVAVLVSLAGRAGRCCKGSSQSTSIMGRPNIRKVVRMKQWYTSKSWLAIFLSLVDEWKSMVNDVFLKCSSNCSWKLKRLNGCLQRLTASVYCIFMIHESFCQERTFLSIITAAGSSVNRRVASKHTVLTNCDVLWQQNWTCIMWAISESSAICDRFCMCVWGGEPSASLWVLSEWQSRNIHKYTLSFSWQSISSKLIFF